MDRLERKMRTEGFILAGPSSFRGHFENLKLFMRKKWVSPTEGNSQQHVPLHHKSQGSTTTTVFTCLSAGLEIEVSL